MTDLSRYDDAVKAARVQITGTTYYEGRPPTVTDALVAYADALAEAEANPRDEFHTMDELYHYRMLYNAAFVNQRAVPVSKSWRHSDGELCFDGGWFVVYAILPTGQVSNHYKAEHWGLFRIPEVERAPEWDGHDPQEAALRLERYLRGESL